MPRSNKSRQHCNCAARSMSPDIIPVASESGSFQKTVRQVRRSTTLAHAFDSEGNNSSLDGPSAGQITSVMQSSTSLRESCGIVKNTGLGA